MFKSKQLSSIWPSNNPKDIPFTEYICKLCGYKIELQSCGSYYLSEPSFEERIREHLREHLLEHCPEEFLLKCANINLLTANGGFDRVLINNITIKDET